MSEVEPNTIKSAIAYLRTVMVEAEAERQPASIELKWHDSLLDLSIKLDAMPATYVAEICRKAILFLTASEDGTLLAEDEARVSVKCDNNGTSFAIFGDDGSPLVVGEDWSNLSTRLPRYY